MADTYSVTPGEVANELPGLFPAGFTQVSRPSLAQIVSLIATADTIITLAVIDATGGIPAVTDRAAPLARRYIIEWVKAQVLRVVYAANDPQSVTSAVAPYDAAVTQLLASINLMGSQAIGAGDAAPRMGVAYTVPDRALIVTDDQLGDGSSGRRRMF